jgi:hypothetical protein
MAYSTSNPPALVSQMAGKTGGSTWVYDSTDAATVVRVDGYITDAEDLGMAVGDVVHQRDTAGGTVAHDYVVLAINANGSAELSNGTATPVLTDTD